MKWSMFTTYVQYRPVNGSSDEVVVEKIAASVQATTYRSVECNVKYLVSMWSENIFGNSSASEEVSIVTIGMYE